MIQEWSNVPKSEAASSSSSSSSPKAKGGSLLLPNQLPQQLQQQQQPSLPTYMGMDQLVNKPGLEPPALGERNSC